MVSSIKSIGTSGHLPDATRHNMDPIINVFTNYVALQE